MIIPHSRPTLGMAEAKAAQKVIHSLWIAQGPQVEAFEKAMARFLGVKGAVAVSSGTAALTLLLKALGVGEGGEVLMPSFACMALAHACRWAGARPRPADITEHDFNLSPMAARRALNRRTKAVVLTNAFGAPADVKTFVKLGVPVVEDLAQSLGAHLPAGEKLGTLGAAGILSFYATKLMTTGEGGMVVSNNAALLDRVRDLRDYDEKLGGALRFNFKMTDIQAAVGLVQLKRLPRFLKRRYDIAHFYSTSLLATSHVEPPRPTKGRVFYRYVVRVPPNTLEPALKRLERGGVAARRALFCPLHRQLKMPGRFPVTDRVWSEALSLPLYPSITRRQREHVARWARWVL